MDLFLAPESWPFTVAALLLVAIAVIEGLALLVGMSLSGWLDHFVPDAAHGVEGASDSWLGVLPIPGWVGFTSAKCRSWCCW